MPEVRREAAKVYGIIEQVMPDYSQKHCQRLDFTPVFDGFKGTKWLEMRRFRVKKASKTGGNRGFLGRSAGFRAVFA